MTTNPFRISNSELLCACGEISYLHNGKTTLSPAFEINEKAKIKLKIPRSLSANKIIISLYKSDDKKVISLNAVWYDFESVYDLYFIPLPIKDLNVGIYFFDIEIYSGFGITYAHNISNKIHFSEKKSSTKFQLSISNFEYPYPDDFSGGIIYHIFVDRFNRGGNCEKKEDKIIVQNWDEEIPEYPEYPGAPIKNNYFYGGTLWGIADKLDYIKSLGVTAIYLSPIFDSPSNHKYDTGDYTTTDIMFGGEEALKHLILKAKRKGITLILDGVFNHTGADSIYFNRYGNYPSIGAYQSINSPYYSWFDFKNHPNDYTCWWGIEILPRINPDNPECRDYFIGKGGIIEKYAKMGIGGFRLDVVDELSDGFIKEIKSKLFESNKRTILYGEVWEDASNKIAYQKQKKYYLGNELDGVMNYPLRMGIISFLREKKIDELLYALTDVTFNAPKRIRDLQMNLLGSHDTERILTALSGESSKGKTNDYLCSVRMSDAEYNIGKAKLISAYTLISTLPGVPCIYYGDEAGMQGYSDPFNRRAYPWGKEDKELLDHYRKIGKIRRDNPVYKNGEFKLLYLDSDLLIFARYDSYSAYVTVINNSNCEKTVTLKTSAYSILNDKRSKEFKIKGNNAEIIKTKKDTHIFF